MSLRNFFGLFSESETEKLNNAFTFNWNDYHTEAASKALLPTVEAHLLQVDPSTNWPDYAQLAYKVATFHNHVTRDPDKALQFLKLAEVTFKDDAWLQCHIAFSFQQKLFAANKNYDEAGKKEFYEKAKDACVDILRHASDPKAVAFARCVYALTEYEHGNVTLALNLYDQALIQYEQMNAFDDQYARAKNRWAMMLVETKQFDKAATAFEELKAYWDQPGLENNRYRERFLKVYEDFENQQHPRPKMS